jgi:uncharacterized protein (TIGR04168 family)
MLVVGDVHGMWDATDQHFVEGGRQDMVLFLGDFGEEDVELIARVAALSCTKAVVLGNHDAWWAMRNGGDDRRVREQIALLGSDLLAWSSRTLGEVALLVGGRPFSWGGSWSQYSDFYARLFGIADEAASVERTLQAAARAPGLPVILTGHNGPRGLGEGRDAIYGRDFRKPFVDFGDSDLESAAQRLRAAGRPLIATVGGHMHHRLRGGGLRRRVVTTGGTIHVNAAVVPRHLRRGEAGLRRHFLRLVVEARGLAALEDLWVDDAGRVADRKSLLTST